MNDRPSFSPQKAARVAAILLAAEERIAREEQAERDAIKEAS